MKTTIAALFSLLLLSACGPSAPPPDPADLEPPPPEDAPALVGGKEELQAARAGEPVPVAKGRQKTSCPGIDGALSGLILAEDRAAFAKSKGLAMVGDRVRVVAELTAEDADLEGPVEEELRSGTNAQVLIQPDSICAFAATSQVRRVRKPATPTGP